MNKCIRILVLISLLTGGCAIVPATGTEANTDAAAPSQVSSMTPESTAATQLSVSPAVQFAETDQIVFTIPNPEPFSGKEGEPRPDWLGWGAETFAIAPDGSFWIADTAVYPNRLLHYSSKGELLRKISLERIVVHAYHLLVTQDSLWVLDISAEPPRIIQLNMDGGIQSSINIPEEIMMHEGQVISNGVSNLFPGQEGELFLNSINGYYEMVDASGQVNVQPLEALHYYGHTYETGIFDETTGRLPILVDGIVLEGSLDFFVEAPFLGFNPDGSFALAGSMEDTEHGADHQVRYYRSSGELLGTARQRPQTFYKDWNHHLAVGPDGSVYQLLSNPDHSVQILRLGFSDELPPAAQPALTPAPLTILQPSESATTDEEQARNVLLAFFSDLSSGKYAEAATHFGGEAIEYAREPLPGETMGEYWEYICTTLLRCLPVADITETEQVSENELIFHVVFVQPDGTRFAVGACCGGDPAATPPVWQFACPVKKLDGVWKVMRGPIFTP
jgi:hypothetical protein